MATHSVVDSLYLNLKTRRPMQPMTQATAVAGAGLLGCRHSKSGNERAVLLVEREVLDAFDLAPGEIRENVTVRGVSLSHLAAGTRIQIGASVVLEVTGPCDPCRRMDEIRPGLKRELVGRRGVVSRVVAGGPIQVGDAITVLSHPAAPRP